MTNKITDFEYPDIKRTDYIDDSLPKILARDNASKHGFRRVESFPVVTADDVGMKVWLVGVGNFQLIAVDPEPQWKQLTDDERNPAYTDWVIENYQPLSAILTSFARLTGTSNALPYFNGPNELQATPITNYIKNMLSKSSPEEVRGLLELGTLSTLNTPLDGRYIADGSISKDKIDANFARNLGWTTGDVKLTLKTVADEGWVMMNDGSISLAGYYNSNGDLVKAYDATNFDTQELFYLLWNNFSNDILHIQTASGVETTRGATATADWTARKRMPLPKTMGRALAGAGSGAGLTSRVLGSSVGKESYITSEPNAAILKDGTIIQWGFAQNNTWVTFPIPYTSADSYRLGGLWTWWGKYCDGVCIASKTNTGFQFNNRSIDWIAIGK